MAVVRVFRDDIEGSASLVCPKCGMPLQLAVERRKRLVIGYDSRLRLRPGQAALLVCPALTCDYQEAAEVAATPADAIVFSQRYAEFRWSQLEGDRDLTLGERADRLNQIAELYQRTRGPKLPSTYRFWLQEFRRSFGMAMHSLRGALKDGDVVQVELKEHKERGKVLSLEEDGLRLERTDGEGTVFIPYRDVRNVFLRLGSSNGRKPDPYDFGGDEPNPYQGFRHIQPSTRFVMVAGYRLGLDDATKYGLCRVRTDDPEAGKALGLLPTFGRFWTGDIPVALVERCWRSVQYYWVGGYRLLLHGWTTEALVLQLRTRDAGRDMEAARALKMTRSNFWGISTHRTDLFWWRYFHRAEIEREEELQIPVDIWKLVQRAKEKR